MAGTIALAGCKSRAPEELPPTPVAPDAVPIDNTGTGTGAAQPGTQAHFEQTLGGQTIIYFDTDQSNIDATDQAALRTQAQYLQQFPSVSVTIEGHADERGTREYNLALGEQRATAAKNFMVGLGVPANRITTISYGKERPVALGSDENGYAQNRRAVTVIVN
jgi:peptidoglycan-associated lipoprotein